jgi:hypothetical protein
VNNALKEVWVELTRLDRHIKQLKKRVDGEE